MESQLINSAEGNIIELQSFANFEDIIIIQSDKQTNIFSELNQTNSSSGEIKLVNENELQYVDNNDIIVEELLIEDCELIIVDDSHQTAKPELNGESALLTEEVANRPNKTRKRNVNQKNWKRNDRKQKCQSGESYISSRGKIVPAKEIKSKKDCLSNCRFNCGKKISQREREELFKTFYTLNQQEKANYILRTTTRTETNRKTNKSGDSRRLHSFQFFADILGNKIRVCKSYWLSTFAISQKPVYNAHQNKNIMTGVAKRNQRGTKSSKRIPESKVSEVKAHIASFPAIESHYCRANTSKTYLDPNLNITKMYNLYKDQVEDPVKEGYYRFVFNTSFNLDFHHPKSDRCGKCEAFSVAEKQKTLTNELIQENEEHNKLKKMMRHQKMIDKESGTPILIFDLENVLSCPRSEIGPLFYHSKLNVYNLTAYLSTSKKVYCAIWTEYTGGRSGNDIASALYKILERVFEDNDITKLITWSDSCVPQNKNSIMTLAMQHFLKTHPDLHHISMKYSLPGHSALQEVDNAHSQIEKHLSINEYFSPMGLIRLLKGVNNRRPFIIIQMQLADFKNFSKYSKSCFDYRTVPFSTLKMLKLTQVQHEVEYSLDYDIQNFRTVSIRRKPSRLLRHKALALEVSVLQDIDSISSNIVIPKEKEKYLIAMFQYMSSADISYYKVILKLDSRISGATTEN